MAIRLGEILVQRGLLDDEQVRQILKHQRTTHRPFGVLAEEMFSVSEQDVEDAWVEQYASIVTRLDPTTEYICTEVLGLVTRRQAWQFKVMPIRYDGSELMIATTANHLAKAMRFAGRCLSVPCYLVLAEADRLGEALVLHFPMGCLTAEAVENTERRFWA